jgi:hypothetical protein
MVSTHLGGQLISPFAMKIVPKNYFLYLALWVCLLSISSFILAHALSNEKIDLWGEWAFDTDPMNEGVQGKWLSKKLEDKLQVPDSMTSKAKGMILP